MEQLLADIKAMPGLAHAKIKMTDDRIYTGRTLLTWPEVKRIVELGHKHNRRISIGSAGNGEQVLIAVIGDTISD